MACTPARMSSVARATFAAKSSSTPGGGRIARRIEARAVLWMSPQPGTRVGAPAGRSGNHEWQVARQTTSCEPEASFSLPTSTVEVQIFGTRKSSDTRKALAQLSAMEDAARRARARALATREPDEVLAAVD